MPFVLTYNGAPCEKSAHYPRIAPPLQPMSDTHPLTLDDFDYQLPPELIAQVPLPQRSASRLLVMKGAALHDRHFAELPALLRESDLLVMNDTRVLHARLLGAADARRRMQRGQRSVLRRRLLLRRRQAARRSAAPL